MARDLGPLILQTAFFKVGTFVLLQLGQLKLMTKSMYCKFTTYYFTFLEFMKLYYREVLSFSHFLHRIERSSITYYKRDGTGNPGSFSIMRQNPLQYGTTVYGVSYFDVKVKNMDNQALWWIHSHLIVVSKSSGSH